MLTTAYCNGLCKPDPPENDCVYAAFEARSADISEKSFCPSLGSGKFSSLAKLKNSAYDDTTISTEVGRGWLVVQPASLARLLPMHCDRFLEDSGGPRFAKATWTPPDSSHGMEMAWREDTGKRKYSTRGQRLHSSSKYW